MSLMLLAVFGVFQLVLFLMHASIYEGLVSAFGWSALWFKYLFIVLSITFVSASILVHRIRGTVITWYYRFAAYWFGLTQFLFLGSLIFFIFENITYRTNHYISPNILGIICFGGVFLIHSYWTWRTTRFEITRITVPASHDHQVWPAFWKGKKIVFVSDVHLGAVLQRKFARKVSQAIMTESPEAVFIGGDLFDGVKCNPDFLIAPFASVKAPQGVYFVTGEHEYIEDSKKILEAIDKIGIRDLRNAKVDLNGIQLIGLDRKGINKPGELGRILQEIGVNPTRPSILLKHEPNNLDISESFGISLQLSGHTHGGAQIWPLGFITRRMYKGYDRGFKNFKKMMIYTSSGVGTWGPPLRFFTKSEIVVITFE